MTSKFLPRVDAAKAALTFSEGIEQFTFKNERDFSAQAEKVSHAAFAVLKALGAVLALVTGGLLLGVCEGIYQLYTWGRHSLSGEILQFILTPRCLIKGKGAGLLTKAKTVSLVEASKNIQLQAYHVPARSGTSNGSKRIVVVFNPNKRGCENSFHTRVLQGMASITQVKILNFFSLITKERVVLREKPTR
jgi:hypothetical protein